MARGKGGTIEVSFVRRAYTLDGITVHAEIDFEKNQISLVEKFNPDKHYGMDRERRKGEYLHKQWLFAEREPEYMKGWHGILDAMRYAITEAEAELREYNERQAIANGKELAKAFGAEDK